MIPLLELLFRFVVAEELGTIILSVLIAHTGWHWMLDRWDRFRQFRFAWPSLTSVFLANVVLGLIIVVILVTIVLLAKRLWSAAPKIGSKIPSA